MKGNNLNVFKYGFYSWKNPRNWFKNIWHFFTCNIPWAWHRATKGYCWWDRTDLDLFYTELFVATIREFAQHLNGAPNRFFDVENDSCSPWSSYLNEMAEHFYNSLDSNKVQANEYESQMNWKLEEKRNEKGESILSFNNPKDLEGKWLKRQEEIIAWQKEELDKGLDMLKEVYQDLWD